MLKKNNLTQILLLSLLTLVLGGCSSVEISSQDLAAAENAPRIYLGLVTIREPELYEAKVAHYHIPNPGITLPGRIMGLGLKAALTGADKISLNYNFTKMLRNQKFSISQQLTEDIKKELTQVGYEVFDAPADDHRHASEFRGGGCLVDPPKSEPCADYYLHLVIDFAGYISLSHGQPFVPLLSTRLQLVSTSGTPHKTPLEENWLVGATDAPPSIYKVLYSATITYGGPVPVAGPTDVVADARYSLRNADDLDQATLIIKGLTAASHSVAERIAHNLK